MLGEPRAGLLLYNLHCEPVRVALHPFASCSRCRSRSSDRRDLLRDRARHPCPRSPLILVGIGSTTGSSSSTTSTASRARPRRATPSSRVARPTPPDLMTTLCTVLGLARGVGAAERGGRALLPARPHRHRRPRRLDGAHARARALPLHAGRGRRRPGGAGVARRRARGDLTPLPGATRRPRKPDGPVEHPMRGCPETDAEGCPMELEPGFIGRTFDDFLVRPGRGTVGSRRSVRLGDGARARSSSSRSCRPTWTA